MTQYINKNEVEKILSKLWKEDDGNNPEHRICYNKALDEVQYELDTLEGIDPYEQCIQYACVKDGIESLAKTYSFNIESELFNQLTKEQQALWVKEIEQACIYGGEAGVELARDIRYKENLEVKEADLELNSFDATVCKIGSTYLKEMDKDAIIKALESYKDGDKVKVIIKAQKGANT